MNYAMILAGGSGSRVGARVPKQFIEVCGKPIIIHSLELYEKHDMIDRIIIVCVPSYIDKMHAMVRDYGLTKVFDICKGGSTYQESVMEGLRCLSTYCNSDDVVLINFSVSPFVTDEIIEDSINVCQIKGNGISGEPSLLCMCTKDPKDSGRSALVSMDRDTLVGLNGPQTFQYGYITHLYERAREANILDTVDPHTTSIMFALGDRVFFSKGSQTNIKITNKEDIDLFRGYCMSKQLDDEGLS